MKTPTPLDLFVLAERNPAVKNHLDYWRHGGCSLETALIGMVLYLAEVNETLLAEYLKTKQQASIRKPSPGAVIEALSISDDGAGSAEAWTSAVAEAHGGVIVEAGVDPANQTACCDECGQQQGELIPTCTAYRHVTLCRACYDAAENNVR
jgi:hypothetical protein